MIVCPEHGLGSGDCCDEPVGPPIGGFGWVPESADGEVIYEDIGPPFTQPVQGTTIRAQWDPIELMWKPLDDGSESRKLGIGPQ